MKVDLFTQKGSYMTFSNHLEKTILAYAKQHKLSRIRAIEELIRKGIASGVRV